MIFTDFFTKKIDSKKLAQKEHARLLVVSDSHGLYSALENIILKYGRGCDALIHCGDGNTDLSLLLKNAETNEELKEAIPNVVINVRGNCDPDPKIPLKQIFTVNGTKILVVHGHNQNVNFGLDQLALQAQLQECKVAIYGHTHIASERRFATLSLINPGSCSSPRGGQKAGFAIITVEKDFIDTAFLRRTNSTDANSDFEIYHPL